MHSLSLAHAFNQIKTTSPINKKRDLVKLNQLSEGPKGKIKTSQNSSDSSGHNLIKIDSIKQL
jgi:hypothetical protein